MNVSMSSMEEVEYNSFHFSFPCRIHFCLVQLPGSFDRAKAFINLNLKCSSVLKMRYSKSILKSCFLETVPTIGWKCVLETSVFTVYPNIISFVYAFCFYLRHCRHLTASSKINVGILSDARTNTHPPTTDARLNEFPNFILRWSLLADHFISYS